MAIEIFKDRIIEAEFVERPNRFVIKCRLGRDLVYAYLPNPGRLLEILLMGTSVFLLSSRTGSLQYKAVAALKNDLPVMIDTHANNLAAKRLIERGLIRGFEHYDSLHSEVKSGRSRFDFLLTANEERHFIEVKSCTLFGSRSAMFPDAPTERGRRHLQELAALAEGGDKSHLIFLVHYPWADFFLPEYHTDLPFSETFIDVSNRIDIRAISLSWTRELLLDEHVRELQIPFSLIREQAQDRGAYMIILRLESPIDIKIGSLGWIRFKEGYYIYAGSAMKNLTQRVQRHKRRQKKVFWHIDYLLKEAQYVSALTVRTGDRIECEIAQRMGEISDWTIKGFGSSDCGCAAHLFGFKENPLGMKAFIDSLIWFRIDRLTDVF